jgi:hypothetical protein
MGQLSRSTKGFKKDRKIWFLTFSFEDLMRRELPRHFSSFARFSTTASHIEPIGRSDSTVPEA